MEPLIKIEILPEPEYKAQLTITCAVSKDGLLCIIELLKDLHTFLVNDEKVEDK